MAMNSFLKQSSKKVEITSESQKFVKSKHF